MGIVGFALRFRHTFYVLALMMLFLGVSAILTTPKDIFPNKVELRKIDLDLDNGATVDVRAGLKPGDHVIVSPPANIANGMRVQEG